MSYNSSQLDWAVINAAAKQAADSRAQKEGGTEWLIDTRWRSTKETHPNLIRTVEERWKYVLKPNGAMIERSETWTELLEWGRYSETPTDSYERTLGDGVVLFDFHPDHYSETSGVTEVSGTNFRGERLGKLRVERKGDGILQTLRALA